MLYLLDLSGKTYLLVRVWRGPLPTAAPLTEMGLHPHLFENQKLIVMGSVEISILLLQQQLTPNQTKANPLTSDEGDTS